MPKHTCFCESLALQKNLILISRYISAYITRTDVDGNERYKEGKITAYWVYMLFLQKEDSVLMKSLFPEQRKTLRALAPVIAVTVAYKLTVGEIGKKITVFKDKFLQRTVLFLLYEVGVHVSKKDARTLAQIFARYSVHFLNIIEHRGVIVKKQSVVELRAFMTSHLRCKTTEEDCNFYNLYCDLDSMQRVLKH